MCTVCGCGTASVEGHGHDHVHGDDHGGHHGHHHAHSHEHDHGHGGGQAAGHHHAGGHGNACGCGGHHHHAHDHGHAHDHHTHHATGDTHYGTGAAGTSVPGMSQARLIEVETAILSKNDGYAAQNRRLLGALGAFAVNLVSSPGSGKTTLLCRTIRELHDAPLAVIEGDQQTALDADRIRATGARALQVNTGKGCHLDAHMVGHAIDTLRPRPESLLFIENVGNLVCPAAFDLGEDAKVAILSVTEGEDKPLKYPDMFTAAKLALINKVDLAAACEADLEAYEANLRRVNPTIEILRVSARTGEGMDLWLDWLRGGLAAKAHPRAAE